MSRQITVYGVDDCPDTIQTRQHLDEQGIPYRYINIDADQAARQWVLQQNDETEKTPTVDLGGLVLSVPSDGELDIGLRRQGFVSRRAQWPVDDAGQPSPPAS